jgi:hypothetical protein
VDGFIIFGVADINNNEQRFVGRGPRYRDREGRRNSICDVINTEEWQKPKIQCDGGDVY